jgi:alpha-tubulin suppressor-like RCC1 family protein
LNAGQLASHFLYSSPSEGRAFAWGSGTSGQLGVGAAADSKSAIRVHTLTSGVADSCAGETHSVFLDAFGAVWTVGSNLYAQLGSGTYAAQHTPFQMISSGVARLSCGMYHSCILFATGAVQCFGYGYYGALANGVSSHSNTPVDVTGFTSSGAAHVGAGSLCTCLIKAVDGAVLCAGYNLYGSLGDGTTTDRSIMTQVSGLDTGYLSVEGGWLHTCAVSALGGVMWFVLCLICLLIFCEEGTPPLRRAWVVHRL